MREAFSENCIENKKIYRRKWFSIHFLFRFTAQKTLELTVCLITPKGLFIILYKAKMRPVFQIIQISFICVCLPFETNVPVSQISISILYQTKQILKHIPNKKRDY
jgi:hypothetical protein